jgi:hypothetical protein
MISVLCGTRTPCASKSDLSYWMTHEQQEHTTKINGLLPNLALPSTVGQLQQWKSQITSRVMKVPFPLPQPQYKTNG